MCHDGVGERLATQDIKIFLFVIDCGRGMRERSPPLPKIAHPSFPRLGKSQASTWRSAMHKSPPEGTAFLITVSPVPGKLTISCPRAAFIVVHGGHFLWRGRGM